MLAPAPASPGGKIVVSFLSTLCIWSSPSTFVLAPFAAALLWGSPDPFERFRLQIVLGTILVVAALALLLRASLAERTADVLWTQLAAALPPLVLRGWVGTSLLGPKITGLLAPGHAWVLDLFGLTVLIVLGLALWRQRHTVFARKAALVLGAALLMLLLSLARTAYVAELAGLALPRHVRYLTAPTLLLYLGIGLLLAYAGPDRWRTAGLGAAIVVSGLQLWSLPGQLHWSRRPEWFRLCDFAPAIGQFERDFAADGRPAALYVPADVPYWGPVLRRGGGVVIHPETGLVDAIDAQPDGHGGYDSWLGRFTPETEGAWLRHEYLGRIEFTGIETGRVFFRDSTGRLLFTSPLLAPHWWILDGREWTLTRPPPVAQSPP